MKLLIFSTLLVGASLAIEIPSVLKFFDVKKAIDVTWANAVNSKEKLNNALKDDGVMMLEADIVLGKLVDSDDDTKYPIMALPPDVTSDLTLQNFLDEVAKSDSTKGIKIDFMSSDVIDPAMEILKKELSEVEKPFPVWINAELIKGPASDTDPSITPEALITAAKTNLPTATLSIGWTTDVPENYDNSSTYLASHIDNMNKLLVDYSISQPVTFSVRAIFCKPPFESLLGLLKDQTNRSLTIWSTAKDGDFIDYDALVSLQKSAGKERVYFDIPADQMKKFRDASASSAAKPLSGLFMVMISALVVTFIVF